MTTYSCECCHFTTPLKSNYTNHLETRKHIKNSSEVSLNKSYECKFCDKKYAHKQSVTKHLKSCPKKEEMGERTSLEKASDLIKASNLKLQEQQKNNTRTEQKDRDTHE